MEQEKESLTGLEIAVIGMAGKFPGAENVDEFWYNLKNGVESISFFSDEELSEVGVDLQLLKNPNFVKASGVLTDEESESFDSYFFGYLPKEAETLNPQVRIFHEYSWQALENAGYGPESYKGLIGLYAGASNSFGWEALSLLSRDKSALGEFSILLLTDKDFLSTRISYKLNLKGPAVNVQTACSTSLVAIHQACRALLTGECDMALAGGVTINIPQKGGYIFQEEMIRSPDGHCRAFAGKAQGVIFGSGIGIVVLKRLSAAIEDGDEIYALIKGSAINNDGNRKVGYTAPSVEGQAEVIKAAHQMAEVEPQSIGYIETHGTGTTLGDPVEFEALRLAFDTEKKRFCCIGSVKTNVGHLDSAAGVAGFIKTVLALRHRLIPPSLHFETPNPKIDFENSPFFVNTQPREWENNGFPLRAGVSSFGIGGTNAHVVLEEAPKKENSSEIRTHQLLLLSAKTAPALARVGENLVNYLQENPGVNLADVAYTLQVGRDSFNHRKMLVYSTQDVDETIEALLSPDSQKVRTSLLKEESRNVVFMFPGQGSQYINMGLELYQTELVFREEMDRCFEILNGLLDYNIKEILYPGRSEVSSSTGESPATRNRGLTHLSPDINQTAITQPLIFVFEYALAKLLMKWGIRPHAMIGHSIGEYVAACLSGVFSLEEALKIVVLRGRMMQQMPEGDMLGVSSPEKELKLLLPDELSLAAVNGPSLCVVSGPHEAVHSFETELRKKGHKVRHLHTSHAFHSQMMEPILKEFAEEISRVTLSNPGIPYISNVTGKWITIEDAKNPRYWARQVRETVRFAEGLELLFEETGSIFVEVGPGTTLCTFTRQYLPKHPRHPVMNLVRHPKEKVSDLRYLLNILGQLWLYGKTIDWQKFYGKEKRNRVPLPTYPFDRQRYPVDVSAFKANLENISKETFQENKKNTDIAGWFYIPLWMKAPLPIHPPEKIHPPLNWLVFVDEEGLGPKLVKRLHATGQNVSIVRIGAEFKKYSEGDFAINPQQETDYDLMLTELRKSQQAPNNILHLWNVTKNHQPTSLMEPIDSLLELGYYSLLHIAQALGREGTAEDIHIKVVSNNMQEVTGDDGVQPEKATLLGAVKVIPLEYPNLHCSSLDIVLPEPGSPSEDKLIRHLLAECTSVPSQQVAAFRGNHRWVRIYKPFPFDKSGQVPQRLREKGVYLITGGLGGIGFTLAEHLAKQVKARLILTGRSAFPLREGWDDWLRNHDQEDVVSAKIRKIRELEALGAEVLVIGVNVSELEKMQQEIANAEKRFGPINGVIHSAGIADGAIIQRRTRRMSEQVFESKVKGTLVLREIFKDKKLDFFVLCSSINSIISALGQVAYSAANAYLDAFALYQNSIDESRFTTAINWDTWQEVGMAVEAAKQLEKQFNAMRTKTGEMPHPLFDHYITEDSLDIYISYLSVKKNWVLDEHRIMGRATLPGTAYVEMARAVFENSVKKGPLEIRDLYFLQPLVVKNEEEIELRILLKKHKNHKEGFDFFVISRLQEYKDKWQEHARGNIRRLEDELLHQYEIDKIESICNEPAPDISNRGKDHQNQERPLSFGPRWGVSRQVKLGEDRGLVKLELPGDFIGDLESYKLHPALLDTALAGAFTSGSYFLPFSYKSIKIYGGLQPRVISYIKKLDKDKKQNEFKNYQIAIMDEKGKALLDIEQYTLKKVPGEIIQSQDIGSVPPPGLSLSNYIEPGLPLPGNGSENLSNRASTRYGLLPSQGIEVFQRILASSQPNVAISIRNFDERLKEAGKANVFDSSAMSERQDLPKPKYTRPELSTKYIKPENETEKKIAEVFQKMLGIDQIGVNDNFFELGANSLMLVTVNSQLKKIFTKDISVVDIYAYPTIKSLKEYLSQQEMSMDISQEETEMLKKKKEKGKEKLKQRKQRRKELLNE